MIIDTLITDRTAADVERLKRLNGKGWANMTPEERGEWLNGETEPFFDESGEQLYDLNNEQLFLRNGVIKGAYNAADLNRVQEACEYVAARLSQYGYAADVQKIPHIRHEPGRLPEVTPSYIDYEWQDGDIPKPSEMAVYIANVAACRAALTVYQTTPPTPDDMQRLTYSEANAIEQILKDVDSIIPQIQRDFIYCAEAQCGEF